MKEKKSGKLVYTFMQGKCEVCNEPVTFIKTKLTPEDATRPRCWCGLKPKRWEKKATILAESQIEAVLKFHKMEKDYASKNSKA